VIHTPTSSFKTPFENQIAATVRETMYATRSQSGLSVHAKYLLQELSLQASGFVPRREWIKKRLQAGEHVTRRVLKELRDAGHLVARHYKCPETGRVVGKSYVFLKSKIQGAAKRFARAIGQPDDDAPVIDFQQLGFVSQQHFRDRYNVDAKWQGQQQLRYDAGQWLTESEVLARRKAKKIRDFTETSVSAIHKTIIGSAAVARCNWALKGVDFCAAWNHLAEQKDREESEVYLGF